MLHIVLGSDGGQKIKLLACGAGVQGSNRGLTTLIPDIGYLLLLSHNKAERLFKLL